MTYIGEFKELKHGDPAGPSLKEAVRPQADPDEVHIVKYLLGGTVYAAAPGMVNDVLNPARPIIGALTVLTDGTYKWYSDLAHYVLQYHIALDPKFVEHARKNNWTVPAS